MTADEAVSRVQGFGMVHRSEYMTPEEEAVAFGTTGGLPDAQLQRVRDRLLVVTPQGWLNPTSRTAHRWGLHSFQIKGTQYHQAALWSGRFTPDAPLRLEREPRNAHDANAIAIYADGCRRRSKMRP